jgi:hypothetical protein
VQQTTVLRLQQDIARKNLASLTASLTATTHSLDGATRRKAHYNALIRGGWSTEENFAFGLRTGAMVYHAMSGVMSTIGGVMSAIPNTFGLACGGGNFGGPMAGAAAAFATVGGIMEQSAVLTDISGNYKRREQDWRLQYDMADSEMNMLSAQADSLREQITMQHKQIALTETEHAFSQAVYTLQKNRFTGQELYNWMAGRLSALYYQMYDATVPVCLQALSALRQELGTVPGAGLFRAGGWNDLYQGLLAGEYLSLELQKLDNVWLEHSASGLEAVRTVSLAVLRNESSGSLSGAIADVLDDSPEADGKDKNGILTMNTGIFYATLKLDLLELSKTYNMQNKAAFIKNVSVTLPGLLGPYQNIEATLTSHDNRVATLSHGMQDNGRFVPTVEGDRFQPFEGINPDASGATLTLNIFNAEENGAQRPFVESLSDIIFHIQYILRDANQ